MSEKIDYCLGCAISPICKEDNPESCELYQNHQELAKIIENFSSGDWAEIERIAKSYEEGIKSTTKSIKEILKEVN